VTVVVTNGAIASFDITASGFVSHGPSEDATLSIVPALIGATSATVDSALDSKTTGATETAKILLSAAKVALAHYDANNGGSN